MYIEPKLAYQSSLPGDLAWKGSLIPFGSKTSDFGPDNLCCHPQGSASLDEQNEESLKHLIIPDFISPSLY